MKLPPLLASLAVAATASAADLKDPSEVARAWDETIAREKPVTGDLSLRGMIAPAPREVPTPEVPLLRDKPADNFKVPPWGSPAPKRPGPSLDAPRRRAPDELPNNAPMPRGAKPWLYGGQTYWVLPLIPSDPSQAK